MKPIEIYKILNVARQARRNGDVFNPLFVGAPGVGKSHIIQQWCKEQGLPFIDLRAAYLEAPDVIGFPSITIKNGRSVTTHNTPEFWPTEGEGVLLLEEPNRGTTSVMNTFMQILTDRKVHNYTLPEGWIVVGAINPEDGENEVNTMDAALKNRFCIFNVEYDKKSFTEYMAATGWDSTVQMFVDSNTWTYVPPEKVSKTEGAQYISPRTLAALNAVVKTGAVLQEDEVSIYQAILGKNFGTAFYTFKYDDYPVLYTHLEQNPRAAIKKLKSFAKADNLKNGHLSITIRDIIDKNKITDELLADVILAMPPDQGVVLIRELEYKRQDNTILERICRSNTSVLKLLKDVLGN